MTEFKIIDSHAHIFPDKIAQKAADNIGSFYGLNMYSVGTPKALTESGSKIGVEKYVVNSTATVPEQVVAINKYINEQVKAYPEFVGLITLHPDLTVKEIDAQIRFALDNGLKGIKLHSDFQRFNIDSKSADNIYAAAEGVLPILFHTGDKRFDFSHPYRLANVAGKYKKLRCIGAHFGGYSEWDTLDCYLDTPNVYFDTCSSLQFMGKEQALAIIEKFGYRRFMFGTDFPMWTHAEEMQRFMSLNLIKEQAEHILYNNAAEFYGI